MENCDDSNKPIVIKVDLKCCNKCPNKLMKAFLRIHGVQSVDVNQQRNLLVVTGKVDPNMLLDFIKSRGKEASLGSLNDLNKRNNYNNLKQCSNNNIHKDGDHHFEQTHDDTAAGMDQCPQYFQENQQNRGKKCYCNGDPNYNKRRDKDDHVVENFEGPKFEELDEKMCKDPYCRIHIRNHGSVPPVYHIPSMYWDHQQPHGLGRNGFFPVGRNPPGPPPPLFRETYPPPPYCYPSSAPPTPYGGSFYPRRPPFGQGYSGDDFYNDEGIGGCSAM
ncbi:hypothetical protein Leryth_022596 [Lithospermum erythrorhizon]|nr:hypothetical protein Leryth_022596 [Lithospermum erythrorhizon]